MAALQTPYLLFLGAARDLAEAKTAHGIAHWRPEACLGQLRLPGCQVDLGLPDLTLDAAAAKGARTLVIGVANRGGVIAPDWQELLIAAARAGLDIANGLHNRLTALPELVSAANRAGTRLIDIREPAPNLPIANGEKRPGLRLLAVGTDCSLGKMFTALAITAEMQRRGLKADFRATGQTGILIAGDGVPIDAVVADFIAGAAEQLTPAADPDHWDVIEGQGSLFHPSFAGVSLGLLHGSQPDALVMCHEPGRTVMRGLKNRAPPDIAECIAVTETMARIVNPAVQTVGVALNTSAMAADAAQAYMRQLSAELGLPVVDPVRTGVGPLVERMTALWPN